MSRRRSKAARKPFTAAERTWIADHVAAGGFLQELVRPMGRTLKELSAENRAMVAAANRARHEAAKADDWRDELEGGVPATMRNAGDWVLGTAKVAVTPHSYDGVDMRVEFIPDDQDAVPTAQWGLGGVIEAAEWSWTATVLNPPVDRAAALRAVDAITRQQVRVTLVLAEPN